MKFSAPFERDYAWYFKWRRIFNFDGTADYTNPNGKSLIEYDEKGRPAKEVFYLYDSVKGKKNVIPTSEPKLLFNIMKCKGSINFNIKMWAEEWGKGHMGRIEFMEEIVPKYELLDWMIKATENQRMQWWGTNWGF